MTSNDVKAGDGARVDLRDETFTDALVGGLRVEIGTSLQVPLDPGSMLLSKCFGQRPRRSSAMRPFGTFPGSAFGGNRKGTGRSNRNAPKLART